MTSKRFLHLESPSLYLRVIQGIYSFHGKDFKDDCRLKFTGIIYRFDAGNSSQNISDMER